MPLDPLIILEKNKLATDSSWLVTLDITFTEPGTDTIYLVNNTENITYGGQEYTAFPFEIDVESQKTTGEIQSFTVRVSNITGALEPYIEAADGCIDAAVTIRYVNTACLTASFADFEIDYEIVGCEIARDWVTFTLGAPNPMRRRYPMDRYIPRQCNWVRHFKDIECKYTGADTTCTGTYTDCVEKDNVANFGGYLGMDDMKLRLV